MRIKVRYFAVFRETTGRSEETVDTAAATAGALFEECRSRHDGLQRYDASMVAINDEMVQWNAALNEDDEVLFFPPVAGG